MNIQIFGIMKCFDTKKAQRYFKERNIKYQFVDLDQKEISKGELKSMEAFVGINNLINSKSKEYTKSNIGLIRSSDAKRETLLKNPKLFKTPIVRNGKQATVGYEPSIWDKWE